MYNAIFLVGELKIFLLLFSSEDTRISIYTAILQMFNVIFL